MQALDDKALAAFREEHGREPTRLERQRLEADHPGDEPCRSRCDGGFHEIPGTDRVYRCTRCNGTGLEPIDKPAPAAPLGSITDHDEQIVRSLPYRDD